MAVESLEEVIENIWSEAAQEEARLNMVNNLRNEARELNKTHALIRDISSLGLPSNKITGDVLVVGSGYVFPERLLLCTPESGYKRLRRGVKSVILCDKLPELIDGSFHDCWLDCPPKIITDLKKDNLLLPKKDKYALIISDVGSFLQEYDGAFDGIICYRVGCTCEELSNGLGNLFTSRLKPGGYLMGSAVYSGRPELLLSGLIMEKLIGFDRVARIENDGNTNLGFLARKPA